MNDKPRVKTLKRCLELCRKQLDDVKAEVDAVLLDEEDTDTEKLDAILKSVERIERNCNNIREYARECDEY